MQLSFNHQAGTLRGMHYQVAPAPRRSSSAAPAARSSTSIVDLRPDSPTYLQHVGVELTADNRRALYVPPTFAHGFQTLDDDTEVDLPGQRAYAPGAERGLRYDDPALGIDWPLPVDRHLATRTRAWPLSSRAATSSPEAAR